MTGCATVHVYNTSLVLNYYTTLSSLPLNVWVHLASVHGGAQLNIYVNGTLVAMSGISDQYIAPNVNRTLNFIGKSNWPDSLADAKFMNLRIYNRALNSTEIINDFQN